MRTRLSYALLFCLLVLAACGGGDAADAGGAPVCPADLPRDALFLLGGIVELDGRTYTIRGDRTHYEVYRREQPQLVDTTLTMPLAVAAGTHREAPVLHIVGCREGEVVWVTFGDRDGDGVVDDRLGEYALPADMRVGTLAYDARRGATLAYDGRTRSVIRFTDGDGDLVPDDHSALATHSAGTPVIPVVTDFRFEPGGIVVCVGLPSVDPMDPVTVITDTDDDGSPESVVTLPMVLHRQPRPQFLFPPCAGASVVRFSGIPGTTVEAWCVSAQGAKRSGDPGIHRLGRTMLDGTSVTGEIALARVLVEGEHIALFDARPDTTPGPTKRVVLPYPVVHSLSPASIDGGTANTLSVTGEHFHADTEVTLMLEGPREVLRLTPVVHSATELTVEVPVLPDSWVGLARLRAYDAGTPVTEIGELLIVRR